MRHGWYCDDIRAKYWSTDLRGSYDSHFVYLLKNASWIFRLVGERINRHILKRAVLLWHWATDANVEQNPTISKQGRDIGWSDTFRIFFLEAFVFCGVHKSENVNDAQTGNSFVVLDRKICNKIMENLRSRQEIALRGNFWRFPAWPGSSRVMETNRRPDWAVCRGGSPCLPWFVFIASIISAPVALRLPGSTASRHAVFHSHSSNCPGGLSLASPGATASFHAAIRALDLPKIQRSSFPKSALSLVNLKTAVNQPQRSQRTQREQFGRKRIITRWVSVAVGSTACFSLCSLRSLWFNCLV